MSTSTWIGAATACCLVAAPSIAGTLSRDAENLVNALALDGATVGAAAIDLDTGELLVDLGGIEPLIPASNQKLLSSGVALRVMGCDHELVTQFLVDGATLTVVGAGDPAFADGGVLEKLDPPVTVESVLDTLASAVASTLEEPLDEIALDARVFDDERVHPSWPREQLNAWYCAEVSGLNFHANVLRVYPRPGDKPGQAPTAAFQPRAPWVDMRIRARTVSKGRNTAWVARSLTANAFTLMGDVRTPVEIDVSVTDPAWFFGRVFVDRLAAAGAELSTLDRAEMLRRLSDEDPEPTGTPVARVVTPIVDVVNRTNMVSYNLYAEALLKLVGHEITGDPGSWANGAAVIRMELAEALLPSRAATTQIADGSGMSRLNRVSPLALCEWLGAMAADPNAGPCFVASLPRAGEGTLRRRFRDTKLTNEVRGKSGTLNGVRCLSGYVTDLNSGRRIAYSVLVNDLKPGEQSRDARILHERIVDMLDNWLAEQTEPATAVGG
ncbi:MAG: D-alanyl-D-alanine carboxypeptidase/D-alanyl-D-alanine-endopeptidase [Planctomycetota bacterium]